MNQIHSDLDLVALWQFETRARVGDRTLIEYRRYVDQLCAHLAPTQLTDASPMQLKSFMLVNSKRWSPGTLSVTRRAIRSFYRWAHENGLTTANAAASIPAVKTPETLVRAADTSVRDTLLATATCARDRALIALLFCGPRRGEVLRLTTDDVALPVERVVTLRRTKSGKVRTCPLDGAATRAMTEWLDERAALNPQNGALWIQRDGSPLSEDGGKTLIRRLARRAGVDFSSHDARRGFAERWLSLQGSETSLAAICGWAPGSPMLARYVRTNKEKIAHAEAFAILD